MAVTYPEQPAYVVDDGRWPVVSIRPTAAVDDVAALDATYRAVERVLDRAGRFVLLFDLRGARSSPSRRRRLLDWGLQRKAKIEACIGATAVVVGTGFERGFVTAMLWLHPLPWPIRVFSSPADAEAWLREQYGVRQNG